MKYSLFALAAASTALAHGHQYGGAKHASHSDMFSSYAAPSAPAGGDCPQAEKVCTTYTTSRVHAVTKYYNQPKPSTVTMVPVYQSMAPSCPGHPSCPDHPKYPVPTPVETTCPTPGVYTIPAKTITLEHTYSAVIPVETTLTPGCNTYGGVTTIVKHSTKVVCPYATVETESGTITSKITSTTYVCPSAGTYTIVPSTTTVSEATDVTYVVPTTYTPGTYTQPEQTITITKTSQVVYCPYETSAPAPVPEKPKYEAPKPQPKPEQSKYEAPKPQPKPEQPKYEAPKPQPKPEQPKYEAPAPKPQPKPQPAPEKPSYGSGLWSIAYSPFNDDHTCKGAMDVDKDIADIASKGFKNVRVYSTECDTLQNVGSACAKHGMKLVVGIFFKGGVHSGDSQVSDLLAWGKWDYVEMVVVGNESIFNGVCSAAELGSYMKQVADKFHAAGYKGTVTTTETLGVYQQPGVAEALCPYMDVIGINIQPYFNGGKTAKQAGDFMKNQLDLAEKICPGGKTGYVLEAGWPSSGNCNGAACPGKDQQATAIHGMEAAAPGRINFFTYRNDGWKEPGQYGIENHFGCGDLF